MKEMGLERESYLIVDINSHQTKAALIERTGDEYGVQGASETPTTVDPPELDVTLDVEKAIRGLGQNLGRELSGWLPYLECVRFRRRSPASR